MLHRMDADDRDIILFPLVDNLNVYIFFLKPLEAKEFPTWWNTKALVVCYNSLFPEMKKISGP